MKKLTYTLKELKKEAKKFQLYYLRPELMSDYVKNQYEKFKEMCNVYENETNKL